MLRSFLLIFFASVFSAGALASEPPPLGTPAPAASDPAALDAQMRAYIVGTWQNDTTMVQQGQRMTLTTVITYRSDGTLIGTQTFQLEAGLPPSVFEIQGVWEVHATDATSFILSLNLQGLKAGAGARADTVRAKIVDANTVQNQADGTISHRLP